MTIFEEMKIKVSAVYTPATPIRKENLFFGRKTQLDKIHEAAMEQGQHVILYGERGVGKTSLANIVGTQYKCAITPAVTCTSDSTMNGLWKNLFKQLPVRIEHKKKVGFQVGEGAKEIEGILKMADLLDSGQECSIDDITSLLLMLADSGIPVLFIIDEFDRIKKREVIQGMASLIKFCSDKIPCATIMLVGIGNSVNDLIHEHQSIERCVKQVYLERMSSDELSEILSNANMIIGTQMEFDVKEKIVEYSAGFPHYTHLLGKYATLAALNENRAYIQVKDFNCAVIKALEHVDESIRNSYQKAIITTREKSYFPQVLTACALVLTDEHGTFRATDLEDVLKDKLGLNLKLQAFQYHLGKLCAVERGEILERIKISEKTGRYRFVNPLFKGYLRLKYYTDKQKGY